MAEKPTLSPDRDIKLVLAHECTGCKGHLYWFWWETKLRRIWQCADEDCGVVWVDSKREEIIL